MGVRVGRGEVKVTDGGTGATGATGTTARFATVKTAAGAPREGDLKQQVGKLSGYDKSAVGQDDK